MSDKKELLFKVFLLLVCSAQIMSQMDFMTYSMDNRPIYLASIFYRPTCKTGYIYDRKKRMCVRKGNTITVDPKKISLIK